MKHVTILFEVTDTSAIAMAPKLQKLLDWFALIDKMVTYVNDEGPTCKLVQVPQILLYHAIPL